MIASHDAPVATGLLGIVIGSLVVGCSREAVRPPHGASWAGGSAATSQTQAWFSVAQPRTYSDDEWTTALQSKLAPGELVLVSNPLACTAEMTNTATACVRHVRGDAEIAKALYQALMARMTTNLTDSPRRHTARELFWTWRDSQVPARCQDLSYLYTALARSVGLRGFFVEVDEDCYGGRGLHSCAAVFVHNKAVLVDPSTPLVPRTLSLRSSMICRQRLPVFVSAVRSKNARLPVS